MIVKTIWENLLYYYVLGTAFTSPARILMCILLSIVALPIDIILLPLELVSVIVYKNIWGKED